MTKVIAIIGGKGGVGKTTVTSNLATALTKLGNEVIAIDANLTTPNLGLHLGYHLAPRNLHDVLKGETRIRNAIYAHPIGFKVIPGSLSVDDLKDVDAGRLSDVTLNLIGKTDFILLDAAAGLGREAISAINAADEILVVTNPDLPSVADALKVISLAKKRKKNITGVVVNRVKGKWYELRRKEIEEMLSAPIIAEIPEDKNVDVSIKMKVPVITFSPESDIAVEVNRIAHHVSNKEFSGKRKEKRYNLVQRLSRWLIS
ncbi:P-loop NTPase [archaeon]|nr:P-loop NTPase [archaeon]